MFERRLKIFFGILAAVTLVVLLRAFQLQVVRGSEFQQMASENMRRTTLIETVRGSILDFKGRVLAKDEPCTDAAVYYQAIARDERWIRTYAVNRLGQTLRKTPKEQREKLIEDEIKRVNADIDAMWIELAKIAGKTPEEIHQVQLAVRHRIQARYRHLWFRRFSTARAQHEKEQEGDSWLANLSIGQGGKPELDGFDVVVAEQTQPHVIVPNISAEVYGRLKKNAERYPGLELINGKHRVYPYADVACHVIGTMSAVSAEDLKDDPNRGDELRASLPNDQIGRSGIEALCELTLRGHRGRIETLLGRSDVVETVQQVRGQDVRLTIDIELQRQIESAFRHVKWEETSEQHEMFGAAAVIDLATGEVRALVSYPTYDLNKFDELYPRMREAKYERPLMNRALQAQYEPGSTVKTIIGAGAVSQGLLTIQDCIECTGYLIGPDGRPQKHGRCWTASRFASRNAALVPHHQIPDRDPHPTGKLNLSDALQRSCNIYFQELGFRLGNDGVSYWLNQFGLGERTGIGLNELPGRLPRAWVGPASQARSVAGFASIGQGQVMATPLQMANVAATFARGGEWVRPKIVGPGLIGRATTRPAAPLSGPDRRKLPLTAEAVAAVQDGMTRVVNTTAGTGSKVYRDFVLLAGKTGTAEAQPLKYQYTDEQGKTRWEHARMSTSDNENPEMRWYRGSGIDGKSLHHAWFMGYAPAHEPKVAFVVMLEYGGSGGSDAAPVAKDVIDALIQHGYIHKDPASVQAWLARPRR